MGAHREWLIYAPQSVIGTFITTASAFSEIPALTSSVASGWEIEDEQTLQKARGRSGHELATLSPSGEIVTKLYASNFVELFSTFMRSYTKQTDTPSAGNYTYGMIYDDTQDLLPLSLQQIYRDTSAFSTNALGFSILGAYIESWRIESAIKQSVRATFNWIAKDRAISTDDSAGDSKFWNYSTTTNTPNIIDVTSVGKMPSERPLWFFDGTLTYGGTLTYNPTTQILAVATPTTLASVTNLSIETTHGLDTDGFQIGSDKTRVAMCPGNRETSVSMDVRWCDESVTMYSLAEAGTPVTLQARFGASTTRIFEVIIPALFLTPVDLPDISGDKSVRSYTLEGMAQTKAVTNTTTGTTDIDIGVQFVTGDSI